MGKGEGKPRSGDDGVSPRLTGGFYILGIQLRHRHNVDANHPAAESQGFGTFDLPGQFPQIRTFGMEPEVVLIVADLRGGDDPHGPLVSNGPR